VEQITIRFDFLKLIYTSLFLSVIQQGLPQKMPRLNQF